MSDPVASTNSAAGKPPGHDIFCTPENSDFVSKVPYHSLSKTDHEIRLLKILPDSGSGFVECELLPAVSLATVHNQYLALSYYAGSAKNTKPIKVNGVKSNVFANLHHALTIARHYWETHAELPEFLLWADQICINQFDLAERSHQVGFMRDIYHNAKTTLICLSTSERNGDGMRWFAELKDIVAQGTIIDCLITNSYTGFAKGMTGFFDIATSPWWGRAWVFQEFMVSRHATFLYGRYVMPHDDLSELASAICSIIESTSVARLVKNRLPPLKESRYVGHQMLKSAENIGRMLTVRREEHNTNDLKRLLIYTRHCNASDERDRIYSVLGLASPGYGIMPDYSPDNDIMKLLVETTRSIIVFEDSLSVLSNLEWFRESKNESAQLPSWVIDWRHVIFPILGPPNNHKPEMGYFTNHKMTAGSIDPSFAVVPHPGCPGTTTTTLQVWGILLDTGFQKVEWPENKEWKGFQSISCIYKGSQHYIIESFFPVRREQELWILCGARQPFLLSRCSYGYRIYIHVKLKNSIYEDGVMKFPRLMDHQGTYDMNKMDWRRITIF